MALLDEVGQETYHAQIVLAAAEPPRGREALSFAAILRSGGAGMLRSRVERVHQSLAGQRGQAALHVQQVGEASADAGVRVDQLAEERAGVRRTVERPLVQVQQGQIAAVASQRVKDVCRGAGG